MAKIKTAFFCQSCGAQTSKWNGKCPSCHEWNTLVEEVVENSNAAPGWKVLEKNNGRKPTPLHIDQISLIENDRILLSDKELNRVLGGGIVPGSVILLGGEPGIGKSTLLLQIALSLKSQKVLYVSGEESEQQIKLRAGRVASSGNECFVLAESLTQNLFQHISQLNPDLVIIDSIQTLVTQRIESSAGSISQIRECAAELIRFAKETSTPVFLVGHITKDGSIAGPKVLEHMVDTVLQFEGDRHHVYRILRSSKNRFGSTSEIGIYEMQGSGLKEVTNPSEVLLSSRDEQLSGVAVSATLEGIRPLLIETQALVSSAVYGTPQRSATGFDLRRLSMLLAVLEKRCGFRLAAKDVFLNIAGGFKVEDPAIDLGVISAILSSNEDIPISSKIAFAGEVGLSGEIRAVNRLDQRISEVEKLGFAQMVVPGHNLKGLAGNKKLELIPVSKVEEAFRFLFG
ncbi:MAG: DNA repair protein RadA [Bacteroidia bacterium]